MKCHNAKKDWRYWCTKKTTAINLAICWLEKDNPMPLLKMSLCIHGMCTNSLEKHGVHEYVVFYRLNKKSKPVKPVQNAFY